ncbi:MAG: hypothetical protein ACT4PM_15350 [Gemmatimonadales bacterium]
MIRHGFIVTACVSLAACSGAQRTAQRDLAAADSALANVPTEAENVSPEELAAIREAARVGRESFEMKEYDAASTGLREVPGLVKALVDSLPARRAVLTAEMDTLSVVMPRNLEAVKRELDKIARTRRRPPGLDQQELEQARETYAAAGPEWQAIRAEFSAGKLAQAMDRAHNLKARVSQAMLSLGLVADERAWSNVTLPPE